MSFVYHSWIRIRGRDRADQSKSFSLTSPTDQILDQTLGSLERLAAGQMALSNKQMVIQMQQTALILCMSNLFTKLVSTMEFVHDIDFI